jgi:hypothetical protein
MRMTVRVHLATVDPAMALIAIASATSRSVTVPASWLVSRKSTRFHTLVRDPRQERERFAEILEGEAAAQRLVTFDVPSVGGVHREILLSYSADFCVSGRRWSTFIVRCAYRDARLGLTRAHAYLCCNRCVSRFLKCPPVRGS